jgi:transcription antitermination factor NusG
MGEALPERRKNNLDMTEITEARPNWYAAYIMPRHEKAVADQLLRKDIESYLPLYKTIRRWNGRRAEVELPLFPGYVFVKTPIMQRVRVLEQPGVIRLVGVNGRATPLPEEDIDRLRASLAFCKAEPYPFLAVGKMVRIKSGPLAGFQGKILRRKGKMRLVVSVELIQRSILLELEAGDAQLVTTSASLDHQLSIQ